MFSRLEADTVNGAHPVREFALAEEIFDSEEQARRGAERLLQMARRKYPDAINFHSLVVPKQQRAPLTALG